MFTHRWWQLSKMFSMHKQCHHCHFLYEREPGYFYGAMYVSYAIVTGLFLVLGGTLYWGFGISDINIFLVAVPAVTVLLMPLIFRYSRIIFLHVFGGVKYERNSNERE